MCPSEPSYLVINICFSELAIRYRTKRAALVKCRHHHHTFEIYLHMQSGVTIKDMRSIPVRHAMV